MRPSGATEKTTHDDSSPVRSTFSPLLFRAAGSAARADALDDTLAQFLEDKFPQTEKAVGELALSGAPTGPQILEALADNRLFIDQGSNTIVFKNAAGDIFNAKTGEKATNVERRRAQEGARQQRACAARSTRRSAR